MNNFIKFSYKIDLTGDCIGIEKLYLQQTIYLLKLTYQIVREWI